MTWQHGDILACYGAEAVSRAISWGTFSLFAPCGLRVAPSHVSIIADLHGEPAVFESTTLSNRECLIAGEVTAGIQCQRPIERVWDYTHRGGRVDVYRLMRWEELSRPTEVYELSDLLRRMTEARLRYDTFGAVLSGTRAFQMTRLFPTADLESLFCSELVAFCLMRLNRMARANPARFNPGRLLRRLVSHGTYRKAATYDHAL